MYRRSIEVRPSRAAYNNLANLEYIQGDYDEAAKMFLQALAIDDAGYVTWANLGNAYYWAPGLRDRAREAYEKALALAEEQRKVNPRNANLIVDIAAYHAMLGNREEATNCLEEALALDSDDLFVIYGAAHAYEQLGERDKAVQLVEKAVERGYPLGEIARDPFMQKLKEDERFQQLFNDQQED